MKQYNCNSACGRGVGHGGHKRCARRRTRPTLGATWDLPTPPRLQPARALRAHRGRCLRLRLSLHVPCLHLPLWHPPPSMPSTTHHPCLHRPPEESGCGHPSSHVSPPEDHTRLTFWRPPGRTARQAAAGARPSRRRTPRSRPRGPGAAASRGSGRRRAPSCARSSGPLS